MSTNSLAPAQEKKVIALLALINFTHILDFVIMMPLGPQLMRVFSISAQQFSFVVSTYTFSAAIVGLVAAFYLDRFDRKSALLFTYVGFLLGTLACAAAPTYLTLVLARGLAGGFGGLVTTLIFSIVGDLIPMDRRGRTMGLLMSAFSVASVVGIPFGLYLANLTSWHAPFVAIGLLGSFVLIGSYKWLPPINAHLGTLHLQKPWDKFKSVLSDSTHWRAFSLTVCLMFAAFSVIPFISPYMVRNVGIPEDKIPLIYFCGGIVTFLSSQLIGRMSDQFGKHKMFYVIATLSIIPIYILTNLPQVSLGLALASSTLFMTLVSGRFVPAMALITSSADPNNRGSFMSLNNSIQSMASGCASLVAGQILVSVQSGPLTHYNRVGYLAIGATLTSLYLASRIRSRT